MAHPCRSIEEWSPPEARLYGSTMILIDHCLLAAREGLLSFALFALCPTDSVAQSAPILGYAAAKNANPDRLDIFKQGLTELGYVEGKNVRIEYREAVLDADYQ